MGAQYRVEGDSDYDDLLLVFSLKPGSEVDSTAQSRTLRTIALCKGGTMITKTGHTQNSTLQTYTISKNHLQRNYNYLHLTPYNLSIVLWGGMVTKGL